ncbi:hypothetical protein MTR67_023894 [Solanum verrucosum]|uniref:Uncharacterized protein n=1 Tax=Solanum verrucosum TaxID=315347 RepID=A0AAF0QUD3_SOLVR|nr:hypothetical protein MTR67_023894 [Solanum verrucosum]
MHCETVSPLTKGLVFEHRNIGRLKLLRSNVMAANAHQGKRKLEEESIVNAEEEEYDSDHDMYGFDITLDLDLGLPLGAPIVPQHRCRNDTEFTEISCLAIDAFNSQNNTKFKFVKNLTVTTAIAAGYWCRNTFLAKDSDVPFTFQALGFWGICGERIIAFCMLKKTSSQGDEYPPYSNADYKAPQVEQHFLDTLKVLPSLAVLLSTIQPDFGGANNVGVFFVGHSLSMTFRFDTTLSRIHTSTNTPCGT